MFQQQTKNRKVGGFPDWWGKPKKKRKKWEICEWRRNGLVFRQKPIDKQGESEIRTWILGWWVSNSAVIEARLVAGSWSADSGDEIQGTWSPAVDLLWCRWRTVRGFGFLLSGKRRDKERKRGATGIYGCSLSWLKKCYFVLWSVFFIIQNTHTKHIFYIFWTLKNVI